MPYAARAVERPSEIRSQRLALLLPVALAVAGYARSLRGDFVFDDVRGVAEAPATRAFWRWLAQDLSPATLLAGRPLTALTFAANHAVGGLDTLGYHLVNLAIHLAVVALVFRFTARVAALSGAPRPRWLAVAVAGLFAVHPLQSQAVAYLSQRAESLASGFYLATLLFLLARAPGARPRPVAAWCGAAATFALGFLAKPIVLTLPAAWLLVLLAVDPAADAPRKPAPAGARGAWHWRHALPLLGLLAAAGVLAGAALLATLHGRTDAGLSVPGTSPWRYLLTQGQVLLTYLRLLLWPSGQRVEWDVPTSPGLADPATLAAVAAVAALLAATGWLVVRGRARPGPAGAPLRLAGLGLAWFFAVLSMTSSVIPLADNLVEHRTYLASWGVFLAAAAGVDALAARLGRPRAALAAWTAAVAALGAALWLRTPVWRTAEALWGDVVEQAPHTPRAQLSLGDALMRQGRLAEATRHLEQALADAADRPGLRLEALRNLGAAHIAAGRVEAARAAFTAGLALEPRQDELLVNMAYVALATGDQAGAAAYARRALESNPGQPAAWVVLGNLALGRGDGAEALAAYDRAVAIDPDHGDAQFNRSLALPLLGRGAEVCEAVRAALRGRLLPANRAVAEARAAESCR